MSLRWGLAGVDVGASGRVNVAVGLPPLPVSISAGTTPIGGSAAWLGVMNVRRAKTVAKRIKVEEKSFISDMCSWNYEVC